MEDKNIYILVCRKVFSDRYDSKEYEDIKFVDVIENGDWEEDGQYIFRDEDDSEVWTAFTPGVEYNGDGVSREETDEHCGEWTIIKIITKEEYDKYNLVFETLKSLEN